MVLVAVDSRKWIVPHKVAELVAIKNFLDNQVTNIRCLSLLSLHIFFFIVVAFHHFEYKTTHAQIPRPPPPPPSLSSPCGHVAMFSAFSGTKHREECCSQRENNGSPSRHGNSDIHM